MSVCESSQPSSARNSWLGHKYSCINCKCMYTTTENSFSLKKHNYECWLFFIFLRLPNFLMDKHIWFYKKMQVELILNQNSVSLDLPYFFKIVLWIKCNFSQFLSNPNGNFLNYAQVMLITNHLKQNYKTRNFKYIYF